MKEFLKLQYRMGKITEEMLNQLVEKNKITEEDLAYIIG